MVGWILSRAHEFEKTQKLLITIVLTIFNGVVVLYFFDAYSDIDKVRIDLTAHKEKLGLVTPKSGIAENLIMFSPTTRFLQVAAFVGGFWAFILFLVWSKRLWQKLAVKTAPD
jgi:hypothetical protein